jgi:hypothetical protein
MLLHGASNRNNNDHASKKKEEEEGKTQEKKGTVPCISRSPTQEQSTTDRSQLPSSIVPRGLTCRRRLLSRSRLSRMLMHPVHTILLPVAVVGKGSSCHRWPIPKSALAGGAHHDDDHVPTNHFIRHKPLTAGLNGFVCFTL